MLLAFNVSFKFRFTVVMLSCCDAGLPVYGKHCDRSMFVAKFKHEYIVLCSMRSMCRKKCSRSAFATSSSDELLVMSS